MTRLILTVFGVLAISLIVFYAPEAFAAGDVVSKGQGLLSFLSERMGPLIIGLGLVGGAGALALGIPGAVQKLLAVVVGGVLLTSIGSVINLIQGF